MGRIFFSKKATPLASGGAADDAATITPHSRQPAINCFRQRPFISMACDPSSSTRRLLSAECVKVGVLQQDLQADRAPGQLVHAAPLPADFMRYAVAAEDFAILIIKT